ATLALAIRNGYDRALPTIIDTHLSSIFTAIVLYIVGNDQLKGFGVSLTVGLMISLFTSLYMTRLMFDFWLSKGWLHKLSMFRFLTKPNIDFMAIRKPMFIITLTLSILGFALFFGRAPFNIDFVGGTAFGSQLTEPVTIGDLRGLVSEKHQAKTLDVKEVKEAAVTIKETTPEADVKTDKKGEKAKKRTSEFGSGRYTIVYADGEKREVQLLNPPEKATKEEREQAVKVKASGLADTTVEQQFPSFAKAEPGKSAYFVVRTSEKEPELVQAALDRLLRDKKGATLLRRTYIEATPKLADRTIKIEFFDKNPDDFKGPEGRVELEKKHRADGSPLFIKSLFSKELMIELGLTDKRDLPAFEVRGEGTATPDGQYHTLVIKLEKKPDEDAAKIETALQKTQDSFNGYIQPDRLENFDSQLATETRYRALWAILASWLAIMVYLWFRFGSWTFGLAAVICLIHDLFITLGFIAVAHYLHGTFIGDILGLEDFKVDLPAVAALLTLVGYSVNDTIVVFDRIREVRGKNPDLTAKMINDSVNQTLSRTILSSTTTWLVVFVLYVAGGPGVHLFSYIMVVGVIVGTYSSIYIASPLLLLFGEGHKETGPRTARPAPEPSMA
ncbi:MAG: protein translocase subunit SecF, partial [Gemmataceae bacterium]